MTPRPAPSKLRVLVTGAAGFVGRHLIAYLRTSDQLEIWGLMHHRVFPADTPDRNTRIVRANLLDPPSLRRALQKVQPQRIFHLAGQALVSESWKCPADTFETNIQGQLYLFEAVRALRLQPRILVAGSSEEYGRVRESELPLREDNPLRPLSPYAVSKVTQDLMAYQYYESYGFQTIRTRAFNHTGPGRPDHYALSGFAKQIAAIEKGLYPPVLQVGNLDVRRDYLDVRDVVRAYAMAIEKGVPGEVYNIASGQPHSLKDIVHTLLSLTSVPIQIRQDPARFRPSDLPVTFGDASKFHQLTGWRPAIPFRQTLADLLNDWREKYEKTPPFAGKKRPLTASVNSERI